MTTPRTNVLIDLTYTAVGAGTTTGVVHVSIDDDIPIASGQNVTRTVNEDALNNFDPDYTNPPDTIEGSKGNSETGQGQTTNQTFTYAQLLALVNVGVDKEITFSLNQDPNFDGSDTGVDFEGRRRFLERCERDPYSGGGLRRPHRVHAGADGGRCHRGSD